MPTTKTAYIQANDIGDQLMSPKGVVLHVDAAFTKRLQALRAVCAAHDLEAVSARRSPDAWLPPGVAEELRMNAPKLVVTRDVFWFEDQPKHARDHVECIPVYIDALLAWFAKDDDALIVSDDDEFEDYVKEAMAVNTSSRSRPSEQKAEEAITPISKLDLMSSALASLAAIGDVFTDATECAGSVAAAQNLQAFAGLLAGESETVGFGKLLAASFVVSDATIRADGSLVTTLPDGFDTSGRAWTVVTNSGAGYRVKLFEGEAGDSGEWLIDEPQKFYADLLRAR